MENKKIRNATPCEYNGINFKSKLERGAYKTLLSLGITPDYERFTYTFHEEIPNTRIPFYKRKKVRNKKEYRLVRYNKADEITYTPDFTFELNGYFVIIEMKGKMNDAYPIKRSLFRRYLEENMRDNTVYFELRTMTEVKKAVQLIKDNAI